MRPSTMSRSSRVARTGLLLALLAPLLALGGVAGCSRSNPAAHKDALRAYLNERCKAAGLQVYRTDNDNRATPPTRYAAANGVAYAFHHYMDTGEDGRVISLVAWVYNDAKAMEAAKTNGWDELLREIKAGEAKTVAWDSVTTPQLSVVMVLDTTNVSMVNVFPRLLRDIKDGMDEALTAKAKEKQ